MNDNRLQCRKQSKKSLSANSWFNDLADAAFCKISAIYGQIDKNESSVRKRLARKMAITDKCSKKRLLSVNLSEILDKSVEQYCFLKK